MRFKIVPFGTSMNEPILCSIEINDNDFELWYKEVSRRFKEAYNIKDEKEKLKYRKENPVFDIDESMGVGQMSHLHLNEYLKFITLQKGKQ